MLTSWIRTNSSSSLTSWPIELSATLSSLEDMVPLPAWGAGVAGRRVEPCPATVEAVPAAQRSGPTRLPPLARHRAAN